MNGKRHIGITYALIVTVALSILSGGFFMGRLAEAQDGQRDRIEEQAVRFGQMDMRQRTLEQSSAVSRERLKAIDEIKEAQKRIETLLLERR